MAIVGASNSIGAAIAGDFNVISGNTAQGILVGAGAEGTAIVGNYVGTDATGKLAVPNGAGVLSGGVSIAGAANVTVGGTTTAARNVISGNTGFGLDFAGGSDDLVLNNFVGTDVTGATALPNSIDGIDFSATASTIGGSNAASANVISANRGAGLSFTSSATTSVLIQGNAIGTDPSHAVALGNAGAGVFINGPSGLTIGGATVAAGNFIENNASGVVVAAGTHDAILSNTITNSTRLGIDLGNTGVPSVNTPGGAQAGPNNLLNYPVLTRVLASSGSTEVVGTYNSTPNITFTLQFFGSPTANASGFGEGATFLGSTVVTTDGGGNATFDVTLAGLTTAGQVVSATATDPSGNTSEFSRDVVVANAATALAIAITASPTPSVLAGATLTYTITVTNNGPNPATGVTVTDALPTSASSYVVGSGTASQGTVVVTSGTLTALLGGLAANASATITFQVIPAAPPAPPASAVLTDSAVVTSNEGNTTPGNATASTSVTVLPAADLFVTLTGNPTPTVLLQQDETYVATVTNRGPSPATGVILDDFLPANVTVLSVTVTQGTFSEVGTNPSVSQVVAALGDLAVNQAARLTIVVQTNALGPITDTVSASSNVADPLPSNNAATVTATVAPASDLAVAILGSAPTASDGQPFTYTVTATNHGPSNDTNAVMIDTLPANSAFVSAAVTGGGTFTRNGQVLTVTFPTLAASASGVLTLVVTPTSLAPITDSVTISGDLPDPILANNAASLTTSVTPTTDLAITVVGTPTSVAVGGVLSYLVTVTNLGPDSAGTVVATDLLPAGLTFESVTQSQGTFAVSGSGVTLDFGSLAARGTPATATISVQPAQQATGVISNTVAVSTTTFDPTQANNSATVANTVTASADLLAVIGASPDPALVEEPLTYTFTTTNLGPSDATGVTAVETLPVNVTVLNVSVSNGGSYFFTSPNTIQASLGTLAGGTGQATLTVVVEPSAQAGESITATAAVSANEPDPNGANNTASVTTVVSPAANLVVTATSNPATVLIGQDTTYTVTVTNHGPSAATNVTLSNLIPVGTSLVSVVVPPGATFGNAGNTVTALLGNLALGQSEKVAITVKTGVTGTITDTASVFSGEINPNPSTATATATTVVNPTADVVLTLTGLPPTILLGRDLFYTANVLNNGPSTATGVTFTDDFPAGSTIVSFTSTAGTVSRADGVGTVAIGDLASGGLVTISLVVAPQGIGTVTNTALVGSPVSDLNLVNNQASITNQVIPAANLSIVATASANPAPLHADLSFTINVTNGGPSPATNVVLNDTLPAGVTFVSGTSTSLPGQMLSLTGPVLSVPIGNLAVGQTATVTIVVVPTLSGTLNNTSAVSADQADTSPNSSNVHLVVVAGIPGSLQFADPTFTVAQNAGTATIFVDRVGGLDGPVSVNYAATPGTGAGNVDFTPMSGSLFFADGQSLASFTVPILDNTGAGGSRTVNLALINPAGGATLGTIGSAVLTILGTTSGGGGGTTPVQGAAPEITNLHRIGFHRQPTQLVLTFSGPLAPATAKDLANYQVVPANGGGPIPIASATYDASNSTVTLLMAEQLNVHKTYTLTVFTGVTSATGAPLAANYTAPVNFATLGLGRFQTTAHVAKVSSVKVKTAVVKAKAATGWAHHLTHRKS